MFGAPGAGCAPASRSRNGCRPPRLPLTRRFDPVADPGAGQVHAGSRAVIQGRVHPPSQDLRTSRADGHGVAEVALPVNRSVDRNARSAFAIVTGIRTWPVEAVDGE